MKIADLFVNLGISGNESVKKSLTGIQGGMKGIASESLAAKAAIIGVVYGAERLTGFASKMGMDLYQFGITTGESTERLQKMQYALMQFGVSGDEVQSSLEGIKNKMTQMIITGDAPNLLGMFSQAGVEFDESKVQDSIYLMEKTQEFIKNVKDPSVAKFFSDSFDISKNMFTGLKTAPQMDIDKMSHKGLWPEQIKNLKDINIEWNKFWYNIRQFGAQMVAAHGAEAIREIKTAFNELTHMGSDIRRLAEEFPMLQKVGVAAIAAIALEVAPLATLITGLVFSLSELQKMREGKQTVIGKGVDAVLHSDAVNKLDSYMTDKDAPAGLKSLYMAMTGRKPDIEASDFALGSRKGAIDSALGQGTSEPNASSISVTVNGVDTNNGPTVADAVVRALINKAAYQSPVMATQGKK